MKRWLLGAAVIFLIVIVCAVLIPVRKEISCSVQLNSATAAVTRFLLNDDWSTWWPGKVMSRSVAYDYKGFAYKVDKKLINGFKASIINNSDTVYGSLLVLPDKNHSSKFVWSGKVSFSRNPVSRLIQYFRLIKFEKNIEDWLNDLKTYFDDENNIYGGEVKLIKIEETPLMSTGKQFLHYPSVQEVYAVIDTLKRFISNNKEKEMNYPMMNVHTDDSVNYDLMIAIQTKQEMQSTGIFNLKRLMQGKMLTMDVRGGPIKVKQAQMQLINYVNDYDKVSPAISFQLLITDRMRETDTSKWETRLYYPVF